MLLGTEVVPFLCGEIMASLFEVPVENLKGIGEKRLKLFHKLEVYTVGDLIRYYPRAYEDWSTPVNISAVQPGNECVIKGELIGAVTEARVSGGRLISRCTVFDESGTLNLVFFNNRYIKNSLKTDKAYCFYGKVTSNGVEKEMIAPKFLPAEKEEALRPIYNLTSGITSAQIESAVRQAMALLPAKIKEPIPEETAQKYGLCTLEFALKKIHFPSNENEARLARKRLVFEELLVLNLGLRKLKNGNSEQNGILMEKDYTEEFFAKLPFELTSAQIRTVKQCVADLQSGKSPMNRLIEGDVGSGKTAVAAALCYSMAKNGFQCAFMAPTEILAKQHYMWLKKILNGTSISVGLLTGGLKTSEKRIITEKISLGEIKIIVGTHALLADKLQINNLGLVVTDEQHRFGVKQRAKLLSKGENPHLLVMSATPIPRTLALMIYGDLDVSVIDERPKNRQKIETYYIDGAKRMRMFGFLKEQIEKGRQVYIVCPLVEQGDGDLISAEEYKEKIEAGFFKNYRIALLHGKMKPNEKQEVMRRFSAGETDILVATTVIEVGVDVPNASVMVVENAERFGLSQLHQLRGRVGRGKYKSYCILVSDTKSDTAADRLKTMCRTDNGFEIADFDLAQRGPGDFFGSRQHGLPQLKIADLADSENVSAAAAAAEEILSESKDLSLPKYKSLKAEIRRLFGKAENSFN